jgi:hypothetical protein
MLARGTSRTGLPILLLDGKPLVSTYDPVREARRFAGAALAGAAAAPAVVVVGGVMGYLEQAVRAEAPQARLLRVDLSAEASAIEGPTPAPRWSPSSPLALASFLAGQLDESDLLGLRVIEWAPAAAAWPDRARGAREEIRLFVERLKAGYATTAAFGALWVRNALANFVGLRALGAPAAAGGDEPLLIAASGPTLEEALPLLLSHRGHMRLWALPSSVRALDDAGIRPDLVVVTDPGLYALQHLPAGYGAPIAMPLAASRGTRSYSDTVLLFSQPYLFEQELAGLLAPWPLPVIPPQGTVAASALALAAAAGYRSIVFAGLDFCYRDVLSHARPGLFEIYHAARCGRTSPFDGALFSAAAEAAERDASGARATAGLRAYSRWFATAPLPRGVRVHRLLASSVELPAIAAVGPRDLPALLPRRLPEAAPARRIELSPGRADLAAAALSRWKAGIRSARGAPMEAWPPLARELSLFLDLPAYARARSGEESPADVLESVALRIEDLRSRLERGSA